MVSVLGFSFSGTGQNAALAFVPLKDWSERDGPEHSAQALAGRAFGALMGVRDAFIFALSPPPIPELGNATGFTFRLQDRGGNGHDALVAARNQLLGMAGQSKVLAGVRPDGLEDAPQLQLDIDRDKAQRARRRLHRDQHRAVDLARLVLHQRLPERRAAAARGRAGRCAAAHAAGRPAAHQRAEQQGPAGAAVGVRDDALGQRPGADGALQRLPDDAHLRRRRARPVAPARRCARWRRLAAQLPAGFGFEWTGQSREERLAGSQAYLLYGFAILAVFLCLAALYESWTIPLAVILVVPLGVLGVVLATMFRGLSNDVYFQVGLITIIGLAAKNAILIIEFAKDLEAEGKTPMEAALAAAHLRFRPIIMTSLAFILGTLPLAIASGAGSASQRAIGTAVIGGMITAVVLAVLFVPAFFVVVRAVFKKSKVKPHRGAPLGHDTPPAPAQEGA